MSKEDAWKHMERLVEEQERELAAFMRIRPDPPGWRDIATDARTAKSKVSLRIDTDVLDWFRMMGPGWQTRLNLVLRYFRDYRIAEGIGESRGLKK